MNKKEKATLVALIAAVIVVACVFFVQKQVEEEASDAVAAQVAELGKQETQTHRVGESFELTGKEPGFGTYRSSLGWTGTMGITIDGARVWANATDEEVRGKLAEYPEKILEKNGYLELTFTLQNEDAVTTGSTGHSDHPDWFSSGSFRICDTSGEEIGGDAYFSGTPVDAVDGEQFYYDLPQGQTATYTIGYLVEKTAVDNVGNLSEYTVHIGVNDMYGSCTIPLGESQ